MADCLIEEQVPLSAHTTLKVGGTARYFITAYSEEGVVDAVRVAEERQLPLFVLGAGSNVLALSGEYPGVVLKIALRGLKTTTDTGTRVECTAAAGEDLDALIKTVTDNGWWGIENLSAIPSSIGAVPVQNVGAYGVEASQVISSVRVFNCYTKTFAVLTNEECCFAYRDSIFKHPEGQKYIVTAVTFDLSTEAQPQLTYKDLTEYFGDSQPTVTEIRSAIIAIRANKFPDWRVVGTAGSFFKNPIVPDALAEQLLKSYPALPVYAGPEAGQKKISLGFILDKVCGLKGYTHNGVGLYEKQALVLTVVPGTDAGAVKNFADMIAEKVFSATGVTIEWEVVMLK